nr:reverse transcriptase domain-containing protein [Tanacetum cinerariifolium]
MSTRSSISNIFPPLDNLELTIRRRSGADPTLLNDFEMMVKGNGDPPVPDLQTIEELCQPSLNGRGGPITPISIQEMNFGLKNDMTQQVQNSCQFHGLPGDDANKHLDKFLHVTQSIKVNEVTDDALRGTFMKKSLEECYDLIENMIAHNNDWDTSAQRSESSSFITFSSNTEIVALKAEMAEINKILMRFMKMKTASSLGSRTLPSNTITNPEEELKGITTRTRTAYQGPTIPTTSSSSLPPIVERETEATKDTVPPTNNGSTKDVQPLVVQTESLILNSKPIVAPIIEPITAPFNALKPN